MHALCMSEPPYWPHADPDEVRTPGSVSVGFEDEATAAFSFVRSASRFRLPEGIEVAVDVRSVLAAREGAAVTRVSDPGVAGDESGAQPSLNDRAPRPTTCPNWCPSNGYLFH